MKYYLGLGLQIAVLTLLPGIIIFQLFFGFPLLVMPICLTIGILLFAAGTRLREP